MVAAKNLSFVRRSDCTTIIIIELSICLIISWVGTEIHPDQVNGLVGDNTSSAGKIDDYTLMIYMIGSDLESKYHSATIDILEMLKVPDTSGINIILETGGSSFSEANKSEYMKFIDFSKTQRHQIVNGSIYTMPYLKQQNMGNFSMLNDFLY